ncbi:hypothetical protein F7734_53940 [Scytonema sp. UIC 10036]|nr:hypothetical protein [Scytonema sp. UIC 10036]
MQLKEFSLISPVIKSGTVLKALARLYPFKQQFVKAEFDWSVRTAGRFMQVATQFKFAKLANLNIAVSLIGALNRDGLVAAMTVPGSTNTEVFLTYVTQVLVPQLCKGAIVVMDNLKPTFRRCNSYY